MLQIKLREITGNSALYISREIKDGAAWLTLLTPKEGGGNDQKDFDSFEGLELDELINFLTEARNKKLNIPEC